MANEQVTELENRIFKMTDDEICAILADKETWQEKVYERAVVEAKKREISIETSQNKAIEFVERNQKNKTEPLTRKETRQLLWIPLAVYHMNTIANFRAEGFDKKVQEAKKMYTLGRVIWVVGIMVLVIIGVSIQMALESNQ